ncbi:hypothetical protein Nepgr_024150 [Nepenthes gracilis]|uniref:Uncharacterized protein n=1 Tax=Nepenthes gracilis TaxID=150966 RepID=A0AAD3T5D6_NEPGR|nr:hypothetical protein Nepgr_024150 [Nepenthes gracilis]
MTVRQRLRGEFHLNSYQIIRYTAELYLEALYSQVTARMLICCPSAVHSFCCCPTDLPLFLVWRMLQLILSVGLHRSHHSAIVAKGAQGSVLHSEIRNLFWIDTKLHAHLEQDSRCRSILSILLQLACFVALDLPLSSLVHGLMSPSSETIHKLNVSLGMVSGCR